MVSPNGGIVIAIFYYCRRYRMVYGIKVAKVRRRIGISSVWTRYKVVLNDRASLSLECMNLPNGEIRSILYGVMNIQKSVEE